MTAWTAGYVLDIPYTSNFYRELAPTHLQFALLSQSLRPPGLETGAAYCELACGQGFGAALLAAANPQLRFWGFDFNPAQIANARRLAAEAGLSNVTFEDWSFEQNNRGQTTFNYITRFHTFNSQGFAPRGLFCAAVSASAAQVNQPIHTQAIEPWWRYEGLLQGLVEVLGRV